MKRRLFLLALLSLCAAGCFVVLEEERSVYGAGKTKFYESNMVKGSPFVGILFIQCRPTQRKAVKKYYIKVDTRPPMAVTKESDVRIYIDAGKHLVTIGAMDFGRATQKKVVVREDRQTTLTYQGPYWSWASGRLR